jgi:hypothetical protein
MARILATAPLPALVDVPHHNKGAVITILTMNIYARKLIVE